MSINQSPESTSSEQAVPKSGRVKRAFNSVADTTSDFIQGLWSFMKMTGRGFKSFGLFVLLLLRNYTKTTIAVLVFSALSIAVGQQFTPFNVIKNTQTMLKERKIQPLTGTYTVTTAIKLAEDMWNKPGGYLSNDINPVSLFVDNMRNSEFGKLKALRDLTLVLREKMTRGQSQSQEDKNVTTAESLFKYPNDAWGLGGFYNSTEGQYEKAVAELERYLVRITDEDETDAQFYTRAIDIVFYLDIMSQRLGDYSTQLANSAEKYRFDTSLTGDPNAKQSTKTAKLLKVSRTGHFQLDDVLYETRGYVYALIHIMRAMEIDFVETLQKKQALEEWKQIILSLEQAYIDLNAPIIAFGVLNQSIFIRSSLSSANTGIGDLTVLLDNG